jgi:hypothetical protein
MMTLSFLFGAVFGVAAFVAILVVYPNVMFWFTTISYYLHSK